MTAGRRSDLAPARRIANETARAATGTALTIPLSAADIERLRALIPQWRAIGGDHAWFANFAEAWFAARPDERLRRRNAAVVALARFCEGGSDRLVAERMASKLARYQETRWRREQRASAAPLAHGEEGAVLFAVMRSCGASGAPGKSTIRGALAASRAGQDFAVAAGHGGAEADSTPRNRSQKMNATIKPDQLDVLTALARQPATQKLLADDRSRAIAERQARVDRIAALDKKAEAEWPAGQAAIKAAVAKVREAELRLRESNEALVAANAAASNASYAYTNSRQIEESALIAGADSATIEAHRRELLDDIDKLRRPGAIIAGEEHSRHLVTRRPASVRARLLALRDAFEASGELALAPDQATLTAKIAALRASLPKVDQSPDFAETEA